MNPSPSPYQLFLEKTHMYAEGMQGVRALFCRHVSRYPSPNDINANPLWFCADRP